MDADDKDLERLAGRPAQIDVAANDNNVEAFALAA